MACSDAVAVLRVAGQVERGGEHDQVVEDRCCWSPRRSCPSRRAYGRPYAWRVQRGQVAVGGGDHRGADPRPGRAAPFGTVARSSRPSAADALQSKPRRAEHVAGVVRRGQHVVLVRLLAGGEVQLGRGPVELVGDVVVVVRAAAGAVGRVGVAAPGWPWPRRTRSRGRGQQRGGERRVVRREQPGALRGGGGQVEGGGGRRRVQLARLRVVGAGRAAGRSTPRRGSCGGPCRRAACRPAPACAAGTRAPSGPRRGRPARRCRCSGMRSVPSPSARAGAGRRGLGPLEGAQQLAGGDAAVDDVLAVVAGVVPAAAHVQASSRRRPAGRARRCRPGWARRRGGRPARA